jgi:hypothetical protein
MLTDVSEELTASIIRDVTDDRGSNLLLLAPEWSNG